MRCTVQKKTVPTNTISSVYVQFKFKYKCTYPIYDFHIQILHKLDKFNYLIKYVIYLKLILKITKPRKVRTGAVA